MLYLAEPHRLLPALRPIFSDNSGQGSRQDPAGARPLRRTPANRGAGSYQPLAWRASRTFSAVTGRVVTRAPTASYTALATAAAVGMTAVSPMLMLP